MAQQVNIPTIDYDDIQLSEYMGLSTMRQPIYKMDRKGTKVLVGNLDDNSSALKQEKYTPDLILRSTTGEISIRKE